MAAFLQTMDVLFRISFRMHDIACDLIAKHFFLLKKAILSVAFLSLIGAFFPSVFRQYGELAGNLLIVILFLSPLSKILRTRILLQMMGFRRELGILMGYLALVHGLGFLIQLGGISILVPPPDSAPAGFFPLLGFIGLLLIIPLLLTSNTISVKFFGLFWKKIHYLVYPAFFFIVMHRMLSGVSGGSAMRITEAIALLFGYGMLKLFAWKPFIPPAEKYIAIVAKKYRDYQSETH